mmetsp:Transcript_117684/g.332957  ORF Transcript_117684/g.332957 Transcript_117684/m.332957 type:complete len:493 (-) Transcript_117684:66-1544(-)
MYSGLHSEDQRHHVYDAEAPLQPHDEAENETVAEHQAERKWLIFLSGVVLGALAISAVGLAAFASRKPTTTGVEASTRFARVPIVASQGEVERLDAEDASASSAIPAMKTWKKINCTVADSEGNELRSFHTTKEEECAWACGNDTSCHSFTSCIKWKGFDCHLKDAELTTLSPRSHNQYCSSFVYTADEYVPQNVSLARPSDAQELTFYMYRARNGDAKYPLANVNTASIGAVLWYLHNEVIWPCDGGGYLSAGKPGDRKFSIDRIVRYKVTIKTSQPLLDRGMNYSAFKAFDFGEATGPHRGTRYWGKGTGWLSLGEWWEYGFTPGCVYVGDSPMDQRDFQTAKAYPNAIWYSMPGQCPTMNFAQATKRCKEELPGGICSSPTGQGNCTYSAEDAGWIDIDELVGIKPKFASRAEFCKECGGVGAEGTINSGGRCGVDFWGPNILDTERNKQRVQAALAAFEKKYPTSPREADFMTPTCDHNKTRYEHLGS